MSKRSPRYPRHSLNKALELAQRLFDGAHQSKVDADTAAKIIGYSNSSSGAAASALGALRQFGLVDGLRGNMGVSELAMRILQPLDEYEKNAALHEAAAKPEIFGRILSQFSEILPSSDEPIKAFLIRNEGFSVSGALELIEAFRQTYNSVPDLAVRSPIANLSRRYEDDTEFRAETTPLQIKTPPSAQTSPTEKAEGELIILPLGSACKAELRFVGDVSPAAYTRLISHLELLKDMLVEDSGT